MRNERPAEFAEKFDVFECSMESCYRGSCGQAKCMPHGPRKYSCICGQDFVGPKCTALLNNHTPRFVGNSYIKFRNPEVSKSGDIMISIVFQAGHRSGILFTTEQTSEAVDFLSARLLRGRITLQYDLGAGPAVLRCPKRVDDGKWHFLHVTLRGAHAVLMVDRWASEVVSVGRRNVLNVGEHLYLGGVR